MAARGELTIGRDVRLAGWIVHAPGVIDWQGGLVERRVGPRAGLRGEPEADELHHIGHILDKLELRDRAAAIVFAFDHGLVQPGA